MKKRAATLLIISVIVVLQGCSAWQAKWGPNKPHISFVKLTKQDETPVGTLYVWNPDNTGAFISSSGDACIQAAEVFKTKKAELEAALKVGALVDKAENMDAGIKRAIDETATKLSDKDAAATFLSIALFNVCMFEMNGALNSAQVQDITKHAITKSTEVAVSNNVAKGD